MLLRDFSYRYEILFVVELHWGKKRKSGLTSPEKPVDVCIWLPVKTYILVLKCSTQSRSKRHKHFVPLGSVSEKLAVEKDYGIWSVLAFESLYGNENSDFSSYDGPVWTILFPKETTFFLKTSDITITFSFNGVFYCTDFRRYLDSTM